MKYEVRILPSAWEDLKKIEDYYTLTFNPETALKVTNHILDVLGGWKISRIPAPIRPTHG